MLSLTNSQRHQTIGEAISSYEKILLAACKDQAIYQDTAHGKNAYALADVYNFHLASAHIMLPNDVGNQKIGHLNETQLQALQLFCLHYSHILTTMPPACAKLEQHQQLVKLLDTLFHDAQLGLNYLEAIRNKRHTPDITSSSHSSSCFSSNCYCPTSNSNSSWDSMLLEDKGWNDARNGKQPDSILRWSSSYQNGYYEEKLFQWSVDKFSALANFSQKVSWHVSQQAAKGISRAYESKTYLPDLHVFSAKDIQMMWQSGSRTVTHSLQNFTQGLAHSLSSASHERSSLLGHDVSMAQGFCERLQSCFSAAGQETARLAHSVGDKISDIHLPSPNCHCGSCCTNFCENMPSIRDCNCAGDCRCGDECGKLIVGTLGAIGTAVGTVLDAKHSGGSSSSSGSSSASSSAAQAQSATTASNAGHGSAAAGGGASSAAVAAEALKWTAMGGVALFIATPTAIRAIKNIAADIYTGCGLQCGERLGLPSLLNRGHHERVQGRWESAAIATAAVGGGLAGLWMPFGGPHTAVVMASLAAYAASKGVEWVFDRSNNIHFLGESHPDRFLFNSEEIVTLVGANNIPAILRQWFTAKYQAGESLQTNNVQILGQQMLTRVLTAKQQEAKTNRCLSDEPGCLPSLKQVACSVARCIGDAKAREIPQRNHFALPSAPPPYQPMT